MRGPIRQRTRRRITFTATLFLLVAAPAFAQQYVIPAYALTGGGGTADGGDYTLFGTVGQPAVGSTTAGAYTVIGGFGALSGSLPFADQPVIAGVTVVRALHVAELRARIGALRTRFGLADFTYSDAVPAAGALIQERHVTELRTALAQAYVTADRTPPSYSDPLLASGTVIRAVHVNELRAAVIALED